jgi:hypothetical protein
MLLARCGHVIGRMAHLAMCHVGMVPGGLMVASLMLIGGFLVMIPGCMAATRRGLMVLCGLLFICHISLLLVPAADGLRYWDAIDAGKLHSSGTFSE